MLVKIFVNHNDREVLNEKQFEAEIKRQVEVVLADECDKEQYLYSYLEECNFDIVDCFLMKEEVRNTHKEKFNKWLLEDMRKTLLDEYFDEYNVEV